MEGTEEITQEAGNEGLDSLISSRLTQMKEEALTPPEPDFQTFEGLKPITGDAVEEMPVAEGTEGDVVLEDLPEETQALYAKAQESVDDLTDEEYQSLVDVGLAETGDEVVDDGAGYDESDAQPELTEEDLVSILNENTGLNVSSLNDIKSVVDDYQTKLQELEGAKNQYKELSEEERAMIAAGRKHQDYGIYNYVNSMDLDNMSSKDILKAKYLLDNDGDKSFLSSKFDREYNNKFEEAEDEEWARKELDHESLAAKSFLTDYKSELNSLSSELAVDNKSQEDVKREQDAHDDKWFGLVDTALESYSSVQYGIEGVDGSEINVDMDSNDLDSAKEIMDNPMGHLKSQLTDESGEVSPEKLFTFAMKELYHDQLVREAYELGKVETERQLMDERKGATIRKSDAPKTGTSLRDKQLQVGNPFD